MASQKGWNVNNLLKLRELAPVRKNAEIENALEDSFVNGQLYQDDIPLPANVSSTIAIAVSCSGRTFATTHGDHTVKIFHFYSNRPYRIFTGHPRTPWTVKYHPTNPNIVASGCLGYQVRVWDIAENCCLNMNRLEFSIISLSFHPDGDSLAIASGSKLEVWRWQTSPSSTAAVDSNKMMAPVVHSRNIRAVCFHPSGDYILAAAPDKPKQPNEQLIYCNLYAIPLSSIYVRIDSYTQPKELQTFPIVLPQIHLYSDGGFDVSKDGNYFVTCARLYEDHDIRRWLPGPFSFSPLSTTERVDEDEVIPVPAPNLPPNPMRSFAPTNFQQAPLQPPPNPFFQQIPTSSIPIPPLQYRPIFPNQTQLEMIPAFPLPPPTNNSESNQYQFTMTNDTNAGARRQLFATTPTSEPSQPFQRSLPDFSSPLQKQQQTLRFDDAMMINHNNNNISNHLSLDELQPTSSMDDYDVPTTSSTNSNSTHNNNHQNGKQHLRRTADAKQEFPIVSLRSIQPNSRLPYSRRLKASICNNQNSLSGMKFDDYVCIFKLEIDSLTQSIQPVLLNARILKGKLMKAITSTKLSPTGRYVLIGYGVRADGVVEDHVQNHAACEIIDVQDVFLQTKAVMCDSDDEVNIAQFHPLPGHGVVYGTKRGKIRTFVRAVA